MHHHRRPLTTLCLVMLVAALGSLIVAGCGSSDKSSATKLPAMTSATSSSDATTGADTTSADTKTPSTGADTGAAPDGAKLFVDNCQSCHGEMGAGGSVGPDLQTAKMSDDQKAVTTQIENGGGVMPAFKDTLSQDEIDALATYVHGVLAPKG